MKNKTNKFLVTFALILPLGLAACISPKITTASPTSVFLTTTNPFPITQTITPIPNISTVLAIETPATATAEPRPLIAGGWNLGRSFSKLEKENKITLGFLGGSITEGTGASKPQNSYMALVKQWFVEQFPTATITLINAGAGGTGSEYGAFRAYATVGKADLVFIEFAVNDGGSKLSDRNAIMNYTEGIVRRLYLANPNVEIVFVDLASEKTAVGYQNETIPPVVQWHREIANHYTIAGVNSVLYVNSGQDLVNYINSGQATWTGGSNPMTKDKVHPNDTGHQFIADKIISALQQARSISTPLPAFEPLPISIQLEPVQNGQMINMSKGIGNGDWSSNGMNATAIGATLDFSFTDSKFIGISVKQTVDGGSFDAWVDDNEINSFSTKGPFTRRDMVMVSENESGGSHILHIRVTSLPICFISFITNPLSGSQK